MPTESKTEPGQPTLPPPIPGGQGRGVTTSMLDSSAPPKPPQARESDQPQVERKPKGTDLRRFPAFLLSLIVHTALLILLAFVTYQSQFGPKNEGALIGELVASSQEKLAVEVLANSDTPPPPSSMIADSQEQSQPTTTTVELSELLDVDALLAEQPNESSLQSLFHASSMAMSATFASTGVEGRQPEKRKELALARGGTLESEQAVEDALDWLAAHQRPNGSWSLVHDQGACDGRCRNNGSDARFDTAATGLSLLAFLGAGYTHLDGKHRATVRRGVYFLKQVMEETPEGGSLMYGSGRGMYNHGIAAFALCEAYQLTEDPDLRRAAQSAVDFIVTAQHYERGWGYRPKQPGDLTVSGWQIMALKSAHAAGLDIPASTLPRIDIFLDSQQSAADAFYGYGKPGSNSTCTAIGNLVRLFRGASRTDPSLMEAAGYFLRKGHSNSDIYNSYYITLYLFHMGEPFWSEWNPKMRDHLVKTQAKQGHEAGSWYFDNLYGREGGRLYTTAMAAMTLEVYYRFSPLYQQKDEPFEF